MIFAVLLVFFVPSVESACTFPTELQGQWGSKFENWDQLTISSDTIKGMKPEGRALDFSCYSKNGTTYVIESAPYIVAGLQIGLYTCLDIVPSDASDILYYRVLTDPHPNHQNYSVLSYVLDVGSDRNISEICQKPSTEVPLHYDVFLKRGFESNTQEHRCPMSLHAEFDAQLTDDNATCPEGFNMNGCDSKSYLVFNYTHCNGTGDSYGAPTYLCLASMEKDNTTYTTIYLPPPTGGTGQQNAYEISCLEQMMMNDGMLSISKSAGKCGATPAVGIKANETAECRVMPTPATTTEAGRNSTMTQESTPESTTSGGTGGQGGGGAVDDGNGAPKIISGFATLSITVILGMFAGALP